MYIGKDRMYRPVPGAPRISKLYVWDEKKKEYFVSESSKPYMARRYEPSLNGMRSRRTQFFDCLDEARMWQAGTENLHNDVEQDRDQGEGQTSVRGQTVVSGPRFHEVMEQWKKKKFPSLAASTQISYDKIVRLYFDELLCLSLYEITPERIDKWLESLKSPIGKSMKSARRISFKHEVGVLSGILRYYEDYHPDSNFRFPIKRRHWHDAKTGRRSTPKPKDLTEDEFVQFRNELAKGRDGKILAPLATLQYFEALRISEAAGIHFEDVRLNRVNPEKSRIFIQRSVHYPRLKGRESYVKNGFKNSKQFPDGVKELPMFPQTFEVLAPLISGMKEKAKGLIFQVLGKPIEYRTIQYYYDKAFRDAGLPYTATHVLRHGWTREVYNQNPDFDAAKELLGDSSDAAAKVYAKRRAGAITGISNGMWAKESSRKKLAGYTRPVSTGCNWLLEEVEKENPQRLLRVIK
jgi:integrase